MKSKAIFLILLLPLLVGFMLATTIHLAAIHSSAMLDTPSVIGITSALLICLFISARTSRMISKKFSFSILCVVLTFIAFTLGANVSRLMFPSSIRPNDLIAN